MAVTGCQYSPWNSSDWEVDVDKYEKSTPYLGQTIIQKDMFQVCQIFRHKQVDWNGAWMRMPIAYQKID
jgi:hypothetical protein